MAAPQTESQFSTDQGTCNTDRYRVRRGSPTTAAALDSWYHMFLVCLGTSFGAKSIQGENIAVTTVSLQVLSMSHKHWIIQKIRMNYYFIFGQRAASVVPITKVQQTF